MKNRFYGLIRGLFYLPFKLFYPTKVIGKEHMPAKPRLITVSNHLSWADIPLLAINVAGYRHFIAKKEIGKSKLIHRLATWLGVIFINRGNADLHAIRECVRVLKADEGLSIFPEGTRNKTDETLHAIKGGVTMLALKGESPIVPILLQSKPRFLRKSYLYIAEPFTLDQFRGKRLDGETLDAAAAVVAEHMQRAKAYVDDYVKNRRWKELAAQKRARRKQVKQGNRRARREYRLIKRQAKRGMAK